MPEPVELLPCPFCGEEHGDYSGPQITQRMGEPATFVRCPSCRASGPQRGTESGAIAAWNTRSSTRVEQPELVERVAKAMMAVSRPNANPDDLTPAPRGQLGSVPKWKLFEHLAVAAIEATRTQTDQQLREEVERLREENERLSGAVCSGILGELLAPDENEALLTFVKSLRARSSLSSSSLTK